MACDVKEEEEEAVTSYVTEIEVLSASVVFTLVSVTAHKLPIALALGQWSCRNQSLQIIWIDLRRQRSPLQGALALLEHCSHSVPRLFKPCHRTTALVSWLICNDCMMRPSRARVFSQLHCERICRSPPLGTPGAAA